MLLAPRPTIKLENYQPKTVLKYSRITSISAGRLLHAQANYTPIRGDRDSLIMNVMYLFPKTYINSVVTTCCDIDEQTGNILKNGQFFFCLK
jgi:hypothetical protein